MPVVHAARRVARGRSYERALFAPVDGLLERLAPLAELSSAGAADKAAARRLAARLPRDYAALCEVAGAARFECEAVDRPPLNALSLGLALGRHGDLVDSTGWLVSAIVDANKACSALAALAQQRLDDPAWAWDQSGMGFAPPASATATATTTV